jgi:hypothetical protein
VIPTKPQIRYDFGLEFVILIDMERIEMGASGLRSLDIHSTGVASNIRRF